MENLIEAIREMETLVYEISHYETYCVMRDALAKIKDAAQRLDCE